MSDEDRRVVFGELTPKGRQLIDKVFPAHVDRLQEVMTGLTVSKAGCSPALRRLSRRAQRATGERLTDDD